MPSKKHKQEVENCRHKLSESHSCKRETPIYRRGWRFLDLECHPLNPAQFKPTAVEIEVNSSKPQRESNKLDLMEWKKKNTDGIAFQIENSNQLDINKLRKSNPFRKNFQVPSRWRR